MWSNFGSWTSQSLQHYDPLINEESGEAMFRMYNANSGSVANQYTRMWRKSSVRSWCVCTYSELETGVDTITMPKEQLKRVKNNFKQLNSTGFQPPENLQAAAERSQTWVLTLLLTLKYKRSLGACCYW